MWWRCKNDHRWQASIDSRTGRDRGCPICANRVVWKGFNDLETIYPEVAKEWNFEKNGTGPDSVVFGSNKNVWWKCPVGHEWQAMISSRTRKRGTGCPYCSGKRIIKGINDLRTLCPEMAKEWNEDKNGQLHSDMVSRSSNKTVWWICNKGHEWQATVNSRTRKGKHDCPICTNHKVLVGYNDLMTNYPQIANEWNYEKNGELTPDKVVYGSGKLVWWICPNGHEWEARIVDRTKIHGKGAICPCCLRETK